MLQAKTKEGSIITLFTLTRSEIESHRKTGSFFCPECGEPVIIKAGLKMIPHFSHYPSSNCTSIHKGEGPYHELGKLQLYQWLQKQKIHTYLEPYLKKIKQRPDLLIKIKNIWIAIEFQCASTPIPVIQQRTNGYRKLGIYPIWILGAKRLQRKGSNTLKIDLFTNQFLNRLSSKHSLSLFYYCPHSSQIIIFQPSTFIRSKEAIGTFKIRKLGQLPFRQLFEPNDPIDHNHVLSLLQNEKKRFRTNINNKVFGHEYYFRQWLYKKQKYVQTLPSVVYLPILHQYKMKLSLWNWQSRICLDILEPLPIGSIFSIKVCYSMLKPFIHSSEYFPLIYDQHSPIREYFQLLESAQIVKRVNENYYQKINELHFFNHAEEAIKEDYELMIQLWNLK